MRRKWLRSRGEICSGANFVCQHSTNVFTISQNRKRTAGNKMERDHVIAVAGTGYVGLSIATLLSQNHKVYAVDIIPEKVELINNRKSPIRDKYIEKYLAERPLNLKATLDAKDAYSAADFVVIATPTNYDSQSQHFDTSAVEDVIRLVVKYNPEAIMVIKSTIPVGYTVNIRKKFPKSIFV